ncbi:hypothetical protein NC653_023529 [Populus alba x Populus x berolinensis]|uniref:Secreted protein n=1 Tax=Populus alba x Populus x berolinensis TaxID=444605 RepID=A0AAD6MHJ2_9ROSI|nr:hypothetical protein NC653_023529 [Populus alba x Populus x berolinensis]
MESKLFLWFFLLELSLLMDLFSLPSGAKCTEFIGLKDVSVDEEVPATPNVAVAVAPSYPLLASPQASNSSSKETPRKPHKKKRKQASLL